MEKIIFYLWHGDSYVEMTGSIDPDSMVGGFESLESLNAYVQKHWFDFPINMEGRIFTKETDRFEETGKTGNSMYVYYVAGKLM